ncbi:MAG: FMN-binding negative transcriptional regulator [Candidatus Accumulibacter sp.]|nr:FMN-binding negative transcriptional regulator [Accumulibacter sp.]MCM8635189.1 FMN-binding negative transcriptional regulator [Accumulibacter sp.]MCM8640465.1 FMN-binding negative transcriptional regulator [Accumulibacter sp.]
MQAAWSGLNANHVPLHSALERGPFGSLRGYAARANPLLKDINGNTEALGMFHGPDSDVTPSWCPTKAETGTPQVSAAPVRRCR